MNEQDPETASDQVTGYENTPLGAPDFKPLTTRLILWQIAKELASVSSELARVNHTLKLISQKMK